MSRATLMCKLRGHRLDGPQHNETLLCSRCGVAFNLTLLRQLDAVLREQGKDGLLPSRHDPTTRSRTTSSRARRG